MRSPGPSLLLLAALPLASATHLSNKLQDKVYDVMENISTHSWEIGTKAQAILESKYPSYSVFASTSSIPLPNDFDEDDIKDVVAVAEETMNNRPPSNTSASAHGGSTLLEDDAAGDPASLGVTILLANASTGNAQVNGVSYGDAAREELNYLLYDVPRTSAGAISHRADQAQLWSDSVYMVPPFLAYYGALHNNQTLLQQAYQQCKLYRDGLRQSNGLWIHITGGNGTTDPNLWATGNGWAAAGMLRVWATINWSIFSDKLNNQLSDLESWVREILDASRPYITGNGIFHNYINDSSSFEDASSAALISHVGLRLSTLGITNDYVDMALGLLSAASSYVNSTGYLTQVVNPLDFSKQGEESPEGQSFLVMAYAAHKDWDDAGRAGHTGDDGLGSKSGALPQIGGLGSAVVVATGLLAMLMTL
ncbi:hypothetical protein C343_02279 [Cryptococcus neoformans C23]|uniref:Uncharacterized protein n=1 Tax=Cryptococcus neoformans (strain H99 / ATCC 208821 / CBS 10515 / FGSC 9487) TaxID=235443 RepID=J9VR64_CRYN9|nr:hypothetical protein CNAG_04944 [Cryptococcus neoformans var. grubii H99]XP_012048610.1 hypothetical protein, variant [Cryptococcus neoformans var. grubii H99]AUB23835.1 hypothetical protein CKF44_04944 [Cryptococcus neoformans var. grubii]OWZ33328.1 hypothetical protein C347_02347 [Cryptococcus neoformans var. grubii AD2-60a]OWZ45424.1 hypothetical protein C343_02279 [Cryptococcus neoformans var. grubii C23]OXC85485.1 hypothetical protein C344_02087 [Cryptococcus neoformans var. grubii AD1|eukprot:XP_012048609.1 hypothetical protein CNAG_04944 [Cryptococcus neoformans var. grubii H99]